MSSDKIQEVQLTTDLVEILDRNVVKSNDMIRKTQMTLTIRENRIVNYMISKINAGDDHFDYIDISFEEFRQICGLSAGSQYHIKQTVYNLFNKSLNILQRVTSPDGTVHESYVPLKWLEDYEISLNSKSIRLKFHDRLGPLLLQLKGNYTKTQLYTYLAFKCKYSAPIYDMCRSCTGFLFQNESKVVDYRISLEEFRNRIAVTNKLDRFYDLQKRVLEPALDEINDLSELNVGLVLEKRDRLVVNLVFKISLKPPLERYKIKNRVTESLICPTTDEKDNEGRNHIQATEMFTGEDYESLESDVLDNSLETKEKTIMLEDAGSTHTDNMIMRKSKQQENGQVSTFEYFLDPDMIEKQNKKKTTKKTKK